MKTLWSLAYTAMQMGLAAIFCGTQLYKMRTAGVENVNIAMMVAFGAFFWLCLSLAAQDAWNKRTRSSLQTMALYSTWSLLWSYNVWYAVRHMTSWSSNDTLSTGVITAAAAGAFVLNRRANHTVRDAQGRKRFAIAMKAVPQLMLCITFLCCGANSWGGETILTGHATVLLRLADLARGARKNGRWQWTTETRALRQAEVWNELSWLVASLVWLFVTS